MKYLKVVSFSRVLLKNELLKLKLELLPKHTCFHFFFCLQASRFPKRCQLCTRFYVLCQKFDRYFNLEFVNIYFSKENDLLSADEIKIFSLDFHYLSYNFLNVDLSENFECVYFSDCSKALYLFILYIG